MVKMKLASESSCTPVLDKGLAEFQIIKNAKDPCSE